MAARTVVFMRLVVIVGYGGPEVLALGERPDPKLGPDSVLVRVAAASINPVDYKIVRGYLDPAFPTYLPLIPGWDVAGEVAAVGPAVTHVRVGQPVFAYARKDYIADGTWAELVAVPARGVAPAPESVDVVAASCLPLAGLTAYQALTDKLAVGPGDTVLVHAASGGVGTFATQIAVALGARVVGTAGDRNADYVRGAGRAAGAVRRRPRRPGPGRGARRGGRGRGSRGRGGAAGVARPGPRPTSDRVRRRRGDGEGARRAVPVRAAGRRGPR